MSTKTNIEWTDVTDNIIVAKGGGWWCRKISPGCANCYAAKLNQNSFYGGNGLAFAGQPPELVLREDVMASWARQKHAKLHFVASMTDVFGEWVSRETQFKMFDAMAAAPNQIFQVLTKRANGMRDAAFDWCFYRKRDRLPNNIWPGVSVENDNLAVIRRQDFHDVPARFKFVSYEPALGPVNWRGWDFVSQIISGGESGPNARASHPNWHRNTQDFCEANGIAYFFKQWGEWLVLDGIHQDQRKGFKGELRYVSYDGTTHLPDHAPCSSYLVQRVGKKVAGRVLAGRTWSQFPAMDHLALVGREVRS